MVGVDGAGGEGHFEFAGCGGFLEGGQPFSGGGLRFGGEDLVFEEGLPDVDAGVGDGGFGHWIDGGLPFFPREGAESEDADAGSVT